MKVYKAVICNRASTNKAAVNKLNDMYLHIEIDPFYCCTHTFSNAGEKMYGDNTPFIGSFRKKWQQVI